MTIAVKRVYDPAGARDGHRVLVDGIWPRGVAKERAALDAWLRELAPSAALRRWFGHEPRRWDGFRERYFAELDGHRERLEPLAARARRGRVTLLYAAREERFNNAVALKEYLETRL